MGGVARYHARAQAQSPTLLLARIPPRHPILPYHVNTLNFRISRDAREIPHGRMRIRGVLASRRRRAVRKLREREARGQTPRKGKGRRRVIKKWRPAGHSRTHRRSRHRELRGLPRPIDEPVLLGDAAERTSRQARRQARRDVDGHGTRQHGAGKPIRGISSLPLAQFHAEQHLGVVLLARRLRYGARGHRQVAQR